MDVQLDPDNLTASLQALFDHETSWLANLANASALVNQTLGRLNWCGFYIYDGRDLVLGPFQGKVACTRIAPARGVCGRAFSMGEVQNVADVLAFPGHIACDGASRSELVVPLVVHGRPWGVFDLDSPEPSRFGNVEEMLLREVGRRVEAMLEKCVCVAV